MRMVLQIGGVILFLAGLVWFLQGVDILPGTFMRGDLQWAINGGIAMVIGASLFLWTNRSR